jgi:uroporphyrin-III C-methyltransferase
MNHNLEKKVYFIGAGPGDPDLLTRKAVRILRKAEVVLYDNLVSAKILRFCKKKVELVFVGKQFGKDSWKQKDINSKIIELSHKYNTIVRLKGGDSSVYGRLGEEIETLLENDLPFEIIPGITSASAALAELGLPFTHREFASEILFLSGNRKENTENTSFKNLRVEGKTIIIYMGLNAIDKIKSELLDAKNPPDLPILIIENASNPKQRILQTTLKSISEVVKEQKINSPALLVLGGVVYFYKQIQSTEVQFKLTELICMR